MNRLSMRIWAVVLVASFCVGTACSSNRPEHGTPAVPVIFETDMGNDIDDALALTMLYAYQKAGKISLELVSNNKASLSSVQFVDVLNKHYGLPDIPIATVKNGKEGEPEERSFAHKVLNVSEDGKDVFRSGITRYEEVPHSVKSYREVLSRQRDTSVIVISVGFFTNLAALLNSPPDEISELSGLELVRQKVKYLSAMGGNLDQTPTHEFNVVTDVAASKTVFESWPTPVVISPFAVGNSMLFPAGQIELNLGDSRKNPVVEAYKSYLPMPYDRPTWDLTSVLWAVEPTGGYFELAPPGQLAVDELGYTTFTPDQAGNHRYIITPENAKKEEIINRFVELTTITN